MLTIHFGSLDNEIYHPPTWFDNQYEDEWILTDLTKSMIRDIDKPKVTGTHLTDSPALGSISFREISGGTKTLILMAYDTSGKVFNASACGDNCAKWIIEIAKRKDLTIVLHHVMDFSEAGDFEAYIDNTKKTVRGYEEYLNEAFRIEER